MTDYKSAEELLELLRGRGLGVPDPEVAAHYLDTVGHHRLSGFYPFFYAQPKVFDAEIPAVIDNIIHLYSFDRRLRLLLMGPLEKIEVGLRALIIREVGDYLRTQADGAIKINLFDESLYNLEAKGARRTFDQVRDACKKGAYTKWYVLFVHSKEGKGLDDKTRQAVFEEHYRSLPAWATLQAVSFGPLVQIFSLLKPEIAFKISDRFGMSRKVLTPLLFGLKELRNSCAHHEPIWNWNAKMRSNRFRFPKAFAEAAHIDQTNEHRLYAYCAVIHILLSFLSLGQSTWHRRLKKLVNEYATMYSPSMGFPEHWQTMPFWCVSDVRKTSTYHLLRSRVQTQSKE